MKKILEGYQDPSFLEKDLLKVIQAKNEHMINPVNDSLIGLRNAVNKKEIPENEDLDKVINILEKILYFYKQQKCKRLKILNRKQLLQRLPIILVQVKAGNTSKNLLNEICQIIYSLYLAKQITKNVYNNVMNLIKV